MSDFPHLNITNIASIRAHAVNSGMKSTSFWRKYLPGQIKQLSKYERAKVTILAFQAGMGIIPYQTIRRDLLPNLIANPETGIPYAKLCADYGVNKQYVALSYLREYDAFLAENPKMAAQLKVNDPVTGTSMHNRILNATVVRSGMDSKFITEVVGVHTLAHTLSDRLPLDAQLEQLSGIATRITKRNVMPRSMRPKRHATPHAEWKQARAERIASRAQAIAAQLSETSQPLLSLLKQLTNPGTTVWRPHPSALVAYARKHFIELHHAPLILRLEQEAAYVVENAPRFLKADARELAAEWAWLNRTENN